MHQVRIRGLLLILALAVLAAEARGQSDIAAGFAAPPPSARPWVYWFWLNGNITREGITADLEAMQRAGIGGVLIMETDQGAPAGPVAFAGPQWRELFRHVVAEAHRLGLEVNMNNDAGWCGSGGPWITPELAMQKLVWTETPVEGPRLYEGALPQPPAAAGYYRDVAVLAYPTPADPARIEGIEFKAVLKPQHMSFAAVAARPPAPADRVIPRERIVDLSARMSADGKIAWDVPAGKWTIVRIGHTPTGQQNLPAPASGRGLECDKLSKAGAEAAFNGLIGKLADDAGVLTGKVKCSVRI